MRRCESEFIIASAAEVMTYTAACLAPVQLRQHVVIVETLPAHEDAWADLIAHTKPASNLAH